MDFSTASLHCLSAGHKTTPLSLLEKLSIGEEEFQPFVSELQAGLSRRYPDCEVAVLGTCNRLEIYWSVGSAADLYHGLGESTSVPGSEITRHRPVGVGSASGLSEVRRALSEKTMVSIEELHPYLRLLSGTEAVEHLLRVASGLESLVVGEHQILGQVEQAVADSRQAGGAGAIMDALFGGAVRCGRRSRRETEIGRNPRDVSTVAVQFAENLIGGIAGRRVVVAGVGEMGRLTVKALSRRGARSIDIVNRRRDTAGETADRWGAVAHAMTDLEPLLEAADIFVASTASRQAILTPAAVGTIMEHRAHRPLVLIDLAVPRNIDPRVTEVPGIHLFDLDGLKEIAEEGEEERRWAIPMVEGIVLQEIARVKSDLGGLAVRPVLSELWNAAEETRREVFRGAQANLPGLSEEQWKQIDHMTRLLMRKLLHAPSARLRRETTSGRAVELAAALSELFELGNGRAPE